jgi:hypothetical protein
VIGTKISRVWREDGSKTDLDEDAIDDRVVARYDESGSEGQSKQPGRCAFARVYSRAKTAVRTSFTPTGVDGAGPGGDGLPPCGPPGAWPGGPPPGGPWPLPLPLPFPGPGLAWAKTSEGLTAERPRSEVRSASEASMASVLVEVVDRAG